MKKFLVTLISAVFVLGGFSLVVGYTSEQWDAYQYAYSKNITTVSSIENADMNGSLTRIAMAKMISNFAINELGLQPDTSKNCSFYDVSSSLDAKYNYGVTQACQLGLMGMGSDGKKADKFDPYGVVTRAQFGTAFSRAISKANGKLVEDGAVYYSTHLQYLQSRGIIKSTVTPSPSDEEKRGNVMIMMQRASNYEKIGNDRENTEKKTINYDSILGVEILDTGISSALEIKITNKTKSKMQINGVHLSSVKPDNAIGVYQGDNTMQPNLLSRNYNSEDYTIDAKFWYPAELNQGESTTMRITAEIEGGYAILDGIIFSINGNEYNFSKDTSEQTEWNKLSVKNDGNGGGFTKNGTIKTYYNNGQIHEVLNYKNGKLNGEYIEYYEDGKIKSKGNYKNGELIIDGDEEQDMDVASYVTLKKGEASMNTDLRLVINNKSSGKIRISEIRLGNFIRDECASVYFEDNTMDSILRYEDHNGNNIGIVRFPYPVYIESNGSKYLTVRADKIGTKVTVDEIVFEIEEDDFKVSYVVGKQDTSVAKWEELYAEKYITSYVTLEKGKSSKDNNLNLVVNNKSLGKIRILGIELGGLGGLTEVEPFRISFGDNEFYYVGGNKEGDTASITLDPVDIEREGSESLVIEADKIGTKVTVDAIEFAIEEENFMPRYLINVRDFCDKKERSVCLEIID